MGTSVPLTVCASNERNLGAEIAIGSNRLSLNYQLTNVYWIVIIDRSDLSVKANFHFSNNADVPPELNPYLNNSQYILILATQVLGSNNLPTGAFYKFLMGEGSGLQLVRLEQIFEAFNCGSWGSMSYAFAAILGDPNTTGFESSTVQDSANFLTLQLQPFEVDGKTMYTLTTLTA